MEHVAKFTTTRVTLRNFKSGADFSDPFFQAVAMKMQKRLQERIEHELEIALHGGVTREEWVRRQRSKLDISRRPFNFLYCPSS